MARRWGILLLIAATMAACGGKGAVSTPNPVTPTGPLVTPTVDPSGFWIGHASDSLYNGNMIWNVTLSGNNVTGAVQLGQSAADFREASMSGILSGESLTFTLSLGQKCPDSIRGTGTVGMGIVASYSGVDCKGAPVTNGSLSMKRIDLAGTWSGGMKYTGPPWGFTPEAVVLQLTTAGDNVTGTGNMTLAISGTFSNTASTLTFTTSEMCCFNNGPGTPCLQTFKGTAQLDVILPMDNPQTIVASLNGPFTGSNCRGPLTDGQLNLTRN